jgi:hypothetical protein
MITRENGLIYAVFAENNVALRPVNGCLVCKESLFAMTKIILFDVGRLLF